MQPSEVKMPSNTLDLVDLSRRLKQEKLFVANERKEIEGLNRKVQVLSTGLLHQTWLTGQNRLSLEDLAKGPLSSIFSSPFLSPSDGNGDASENLELIQAQKHIPARSLQSYIDLISLLRNNPEIVALCISTHEKEKCHLVRPPGIPNIDMGDILQAVLNLYGGIGAPLFDDSNLLLKLLSSLAGLQLVGVDSPRRVLRQGSSAFSTLYKLISETIPSSRLFLVGALHHPVTQFLSSSELLCLGNVLPTDRDRDDMPMLRNGDATNRDIASLDRTEKMAKLTKLFVESILDNIHAFPTGLAWLIKSVHTQLSGAFPDKEVSKICNDLIWALFICPAVTNPEPFGVTDTPVGTHARHTLSQVATILQALALHPFEGTDPRLAEYISYFDPESLSSVLEHVLSIDGLPSEQTGVVSSLTRRTVLIPENLLHPLFTWLKECLILLEQNGKLTDVDIWPNMVKLTSTVYDSQVSMFNLSKAASLETKSNISPVSSLSSIATMSPSHAAANLLASSKKVLLNRRDAKPINGTGINTESGNETPVSVVVFPLTQASWEWLGMLPESEVISSSKSKLLNGGPDVDSLPSLEDPDAEERDDRSSIGEKRTRFSLSHDEGSIGASDNLEVEAVSEAASTHSVSSSIELEDQNDNLSDMLSANVSGRGTPNVSGRNTPLSQAEQEDVNANNNEALDDDNDIIMDEPPGEPPLQQNNNPPNLNNLSINGPRPNPSKQARSEIEDKFCKFEIRGIPKMFGGDETISLVSDTWSTDVLASDSEMGGDTAQQTLNQLGQLNVGHRVPPPNPPVIELAAVVNQDSNLLNNDTMSEAWSTDVAASDIERLNDFDTDDTASVARSETGRSELDGMASFDTPFRSSVSGGGPYRRPDQEPDLLMFDDMQARNNEAAARHPGSAHTPDLSIPVNSNILDTPPQNESLLLADAPNSSQLSMSGASSNSLQTPGSSCRTGPIPKTISFDKTAERGDREHWDDENGRTKRFFRNFRNPFRGRSRKGRGQDDRFMDWERMPESNPSLQVPKLRKSFSEDVGSPYQNHPLNESSDEILAKYRRKPSLTDSNNDSPLSANRDSISNNNTAKQPSGSTTSVARKDSLKISRSDLIVDARKKLRNVLSNCDLQVSQTADTTSIDTAMVNLLRVEMATAISRGDQVTAAHLQEAMRTVKQLGSDGCRKVLRLMRDDYRRRSDYVSYLMRAKQGLLSTIQFLERATVKSKHEGDTYSHYFINEFIRIWLEDSSQVHLVEEFVKEFISTNATDEKIEILETFLCTLLDLFIGQKELTEWQLGRMENALEQVIVSKIYTHALFPNGDADTHRDVVLHEHIRRLSAIIRPSHKDLRIPKSRLGECPWPPAQRELQMLPAYKTPSDKLRCVVRTCALIMNLSTERVVAADDFIPVLVFVVIKCNPPALLSTIQYVNSFCGVKITGEDQYWWTQFCSAVEFIKTMDYNE
ncbi:receptor-mediated endocytosis protein 6 homolog [Folsomia candida]|uniref:receptor-mediated endocytosis protein 6 homolog n=1 Tax=Folsomia candida TaxID=158441 RepID=UPI001604B545|nr:receptor-mediated endocytosis protein 6 homolog [Folsomia candida]XP_035704919.1 receptor-mediated endocytosis protein 6 homolog [Folsomia candida]